jgi:hypothetical protein
MRKESCIPASLQPARVFAELLPAAANLLAKDVIRFLQVRGELGMDFVLLCGIQSKAGEALANEFLPIRHAPPS